MAGAVYWIGQDGNVYVKSSSGVKNVGAAEYPGDIPNHYAAANGSGAATEIADPNPGNPAPAAPGNPNGSGSSGSSAPTTADKSNDIALQNAGLSSVDQQTSSGLAAIASALANITSGYDTETAANQKDYQTNSDQNQENLQKNKQTALVNAAQGRQGLNGTLASLGALNGSGVTLATQAVQKGANDDLSGADDTFGTNQSALDTSIGTYNREDAQRRKDAQTAADNADEAVQNNAAQNKVAAYKALSDDYSAEGDAGNAAKYTGLAASLFPQIAQTSIPSSNLTAETAAYTPASLASYIAGSNPTSVAVTPAAPGGTPGLVATSAADKKKQAAAAGAATS